MYIHCQFPCRHIGGDYARRFNARHRRVGHLFQGRYKAILVEDGDYLMECSRYIHLNQISSLLNRAKLTRPAERYREDEEVRDLIDI